MFERSSEPAALGRRGRVGGGARWGRGWAAPGAGALHVAGLAVLAPPAFADPDDGEQDRVQRLEDALKRQAEETDRLRREFESYRQENPSGLRLTADETRSAIDAYLAATPPPAPVLSAGGGGSGVQWGGYYGFEYFAPSNAKKSYFDLHRLILSGDAAITDRIDLQFELEVEHGGIGNELDGDVNFEYAEVVFHVSDAFNPKLGGLLIPFGRFNLYHDDPLNDFALRPFVARYLVPTGFGQPGIGVEGAVPFGCGHTFSYDVALTNGFEDAFSDNRGARTARQPWDGDNNDSKEVWGRAAVTWCTGFLDYLETGVSGTWSRYDDAGDNDLTGFGVDVLLRKGPFEVKGEYVRYDLERDAADPAGAVEGLDATWIEAAYHFFPCFWEGCGGIVQDTSLFTLAVRWQHMDLNDRVTGAAFEDDLSAFSVGLNLRITERTVLRVDHTWYDAEKADDYEEFAFSFATYF